MIGFYNKDKEKAFNRDGYVVLDVLNPFEIAELKELYLAQKIKHAINIGGTHSSSDVPDPSFVEFIDKSIAKLICPALDKTFDSYDYMLSTFIVKEAGKNNVTGFHQDPTLIDQKDKLSANIWIALQDTTKLNGCLQVLKGSHKLGNTLIVTPNFPTIFKKFEHKLSKFMTDVEVKAGQGIVFNNKLVHSANPNHSDSARLATVSALKSKNCYWVYYYMDQESKLINKYLIDYEFYLNYPKGKKPEIDIASTFHFNFEQLNYFEFLQKQFSKYPLETIKSLLKSKA